MSTYVNKMEMEQISLQNIIIGGDGSLFQALR